MERIQARRQLTEGKIQAAITKLKFYAGVPYEQPLMLIEDISTATFPLLPPTIKPGRVRVKVQAGERLAELDEQLAQAGLRLIRSQSRPDIAATARYTQGRAGFDDSRGKFFQKDEVLRSAYLSGCPYLTAIKVQRRSRYRD